MPLPTQGPIGARDINEDIGNQLDAQLDIEQVAIQVYSLSRPHGFDEFYGLGATGAENIDLITSLYYADSDGETIQISNNVRADNRYNIVVTFVTDTELQWAVGFIYSVIVNGQLGSIPSAEWTQYFEEDAVPFTGPYNSYRTLTVGVWPNDIGNYERDGYVNFIGSVTATFTVRQAANLFWASINGNTYSSNSHSITFNQGTPTTSEQIVNYYQWAGPTSTTYGYNPVFFTINGAYAPTGEFVSDWIEGQNGVYNNGWVSIGDNGGSPGQFGSGFGQEYPNPVPIRIRPKQINNTYHDIVFTAYFNAQLVDKAQEGEWLGRLPLTITLKGLPFTFTLTSSSSLIPYSGGNVTLTLSISQGSWTLSDDKSWVTLNKSSGNGNDTITATIAQNPDVYNQTITFTYTSAVSEESKTLSITQEGLPTFDGGDISIGSWSVNGQSGYATLPSISVTNNYAYTYYYSSGYNSSTSTFPLNTGGTPYARSITIRVDVPNDGLWSNPGQIVLNSRTVYQPIYVEPSSMVINAAQPIIVGRFDGNQANFTITSSTSWTANMFTSTMKFASSQGSGVFGGGDSDIYGSAGTRTIYVEATSTNNSQSTNDSTANFNCDTGGGNANATIRQSANTLPPYSWDGSVSVNRNTGGVVVNGGSSSTTPTASPTSFNIVTSSTSRNITVSNVTIPSGYQNAGTTLSPFNVSVTQLAVQHILELTTPNTTINGNVSSTILTVNDVYYNNTDWTLTNEFNSTITNVQFNPVSGTGDMSTIFVSFDGNASGGGSTKYGYFRVTSPTYGTSDSITLTQNYYTPPASLSFSSLSPSSPYSYNGVGLITVNINRSNVSVVNASISVGIENAGAFFSQLQPSGVTRFGNTSIQTTGTVFYVEIPGRTDGGAGNRTNGLSITGGGASDATLLTQEGLTIPTFSFSDWTGGFSVSTSGNISSTTGNATISSFSPTSFGEVTTATSRTISATITVPSGYTNTAGTVSGTKTVTQQPPPLEYLYYINSSSVGQTGSFNISVSSDGGGTSIGVYAFRGSTTVSTPFALSKGGGSFFGVGTNTSAQNSTASSTTTQGTGASAAKLYVNYNSNTGGTRIFTVDLTVDGQFVGTISFSQAGTGGGGGGKPGQEV